MLGVLSGNLHFVAYKINLKEKNATIIDSLFGDLPFIKDFTKSLQKRKFSVVIEADQTQKDGVSCGVFAAYNVIQLLLDQSRDKTPPSTYFRQVQDIMNKWKTSREIQQHYKAKGSLYKEYARIISGEMPLKSNLRTINKNILDVSHLF